MRSYDFWRVDVFADRPLEGNPLAVFPRAEGLSEEEMLAIAREMNLSETTFVLPSSKAGANYRNRIFTPGGEIPFAGHPSLGTAYVAAMDGLVPLHEGTVSVRQEVGIGVLPLELDVRHGRIDRVVMTQGMPRVRRPVRNPARVAQALGIRARDLFPGLDPQVASTGAPSLQVPVRSLEVVQNLSPDPRILGRILARIDGDAGAYVFTFEAEGEADLHARGFFPQHGITEDPATGSAAGACGAYLAANHQLPAKEWFVIEQGIEIHHPSRIEVSVRVERGRLRAVLVAGKVVPVMRGTLTLP